MSLKDIRGEADKLATELGQPELFWDQRSGHLRLARMIVALCDHLSQPADSYDDEQSRCMACMDHVAHEIYGLYKKYVGGHPRDYEARLVLLELCARLGIADNKDDLYKRVGE